MQRFLDLLGDNPYVQSGAIAVGSLLLASIAVIVLARVVSRLVRRTSTTFDDNIVVSLRRPIFVTVFFMGLSIAIRRLGLSEEVEGPLVNTLRTIIVIVWIGFLIRAMSLILESLSGVSHKVSLVDERTRPLFDNLAKIIIIAAGLNAILGIWNIDASAWIASAGVAGLALGFAAKDTLANFFSGIFILADTPYKIGDFINLDSGERGRVSTIGLRSTRLVTRDDIEIVIPNAVIANAKIINETGGPHPKERVRIAVGVAYGSDVDRVCEVLVDVAEKNEKVVPVPEPRARFRVFGESSLDFELLAWISEPVHRGLVVHELNMDVYKALAREGIEIPFPQRDLHIKELPPQLLRPSEGGAEA